MKIYVYFLKHLLFFPVYFYPETLEFFDLRIRGIIVKRIVQIPHLKRAEVLKRKKTHVNYKKNKFAINVFATFTYKIP